MRRAVFAILALGVSLLAAAADVPPGEYVMERDSAIEIDQVRNDLALAQYHARATWFNKALCTKAAARRR